MTYLDENNKASIDWNALNADAEGGKKSAQQLSRLCNKNIKR